MIKKAKQLIKDLKVRRINETMFEVDGHSVIFKKKKGRTILLCDCLNSTKFCSESPLCSHKIASIIYLCNSKLYCKIEKVIEEYKNYQEIKLETPIELFINDLEKIKNEI